jgi:hypothetical protein
MPFSAILHMGGFPITSSSQPVPCSDSKSNTYEITRIPNMTRIENMGSAGGSMIVEGAMSLGG